MTQTDVTDELYPGERLGLPREGRGSLASWSQRIWALVIDWAACTIVAGLLQPCDEGADPAGGEGEQRAASAGCSLISRARSCSSRAAAA